MTSPAASPRCLAYSYPRLSQGPAGLRAVPNTSTPPSRFSRSLHLLFPLLGMCFYPFLTFINYSTFKTQPLQKAFFSLPSPGCPGTLPYVGLSQHLTNCIINDYYWSVHSNATHPYTLYRSLALGTVTLNSQCLKKHLLKC